MKTTLLKRFAPLAAATFALCAGISSCADKEYRIDDIDKEIRIASGGITLPLATIEHKTLASILDSDFDGRLRIDGDGLYSLHYSEPEKVTPTGNIELGEGKQVLELEDIPPLDLSDIVKELGEGAIVNLLPPTLKFSIANPENIAVTATLVLVAQDAGGNPLEGKTVTLDGVKIGANATTSIFIVDEAGDEPTPAGYTRKTADLAGFLYEIPPSIGIKLTIEAETDPGEPNPIDEEVEFRVSYEVDMPLGFGPDMERTLNHTVTGLNSTFANLAKQEIRAKEISVSVELQASFPLKISDIGLELSDAEGKPVPGLETSVAGTIEGSAGGAGTSTLTIGIEVPGDGDFSALSGVDRLKISLPVTPAGTAPGDENRVGPDDHISGRAWINLPKGMGADLDKF
jgi:hypothetical protein